MIVMSPKVKWNIIKPVMKWNIITHLKGMISDLLKEHKIAAKRNASMTIFYFRTGTGSELEK